MGAYYETIQMNNTDVCLAKHNEYRYRDMTMALLKWITQPDRYIQRDPKSSICVDIVFIAMSSKLVGKQLYTDAIPRGGYHTAFINPEAFDELYTKSFITYSCSSLIYLTYSLG